MVTRYSSFLKRAKNHPHTLAVELVSAGQEGGWLHVLTELRNEIVHVAPVGRSQAFHFCHLREAACGSNAKAPTVHYAVLGADGKVWKDDAADLEFTSDNENAIKSKMGRYREYLAGSIDGLSYAWQTLERLSELLERIRGATGLRGEMPHITDADIIGEIKVIR